MRRVRVRPPRSRATPANLIDDRRQHFRRVADVAVDVVRRVSGPEPEAGQAGQRIPAVSFPAASDRRGAPFGIERDSSR
jgi:hypothetical protein